MNLEERPTRDTDQSNLEGPNKMERKEPQVTSTIQSILSKRPIRASGSLWSLWIEALGDGL
jgi:hypothetical protein